MRCLLTGATGFLGSHLARLLVAGGDDVAAYIRPTSDTWRIDDVVDRLTVIRGDLASVAGAAGKIAAFAPDVVYHLGWEGAARAARDDPAQIERNLTGSLELVRVAARAGARAWVGVGSQAEHRPDWTVLDEDAPLGPVTAYGAVKLSVGLLSAHLCRAHSLRHCWLRLVAAYGPADGEGYLVPQLVLGLLRGAPPPLSAGTQLVDYLHAGDAAAAIREAGRQPGCRGTFVLASGRPVSVAQLAGTVRDLIAPEARLPLGELAAPEGGIPDRWGSPAALMRATGWRPSTPLREGLAATIEWYRSHLARYA